jgi:hypothetical protein
MHFRTLRFAPLLALVALSPREPHPPLTVPAAVRAALAARGCPVPAVARWRVRPTVVRGHLVPGQAPHWAAECGRTVVVLTPVAGGRLRPDSVAAVQEGLQIASAAYTRERHRRYGDVDDTLGLGPIRHDGLEVLIGDCCSLIYYWDGRRWRELPGAD